LVCIKRDRIKKEKIMLNLSRYLFLSICLVLLSSINLFAQTVNPGPSGSKFQKIDINKDGSITASEMQAYQVQRFQELDQDKNGAIDSKEISADTTKMHQAADADKDGQVTQAEAASQFSQYFKEMDKNNDNKVSEAEYTDYWKGIYKF